MTGVVGNRGTSRPRPLHLPLVLSSPNRTRRLSQASHSVPTRCSRSRMRESTYPSIPNTSTLSPLPLVLCLSKSPPFRYQHPPVPPPDVVTARRRPVERSLREQAQPALSHRAERAVRAVTISTTDNCQPVITSRVHSAKCERMSSPSDQRQVHFLQRRSALLLWDLGRRLVCPVRPREKKRRGSEFSSDPTQG